MSVTTRGWERFVAFATAQVGRRTRARMLTGMARS